MELEQNQEKYRKLGIGLAAISYDSVDVLHSFAERRGIHFPLLSDTDSKIIRELNLLNDTVPKNTPFFGIPYPGAFVLDQNGVIVAKYFEDDYRQRYTSADILARQFGQPQEAAQNDVVGRQLVLTSSASNSLVAGGQRIGLTLDIQLQPKMHVYAPGVQGYIPIDWTMQPSDAFTTHDASYPQSEMLHLPVIDETVPVYQGEFRVTREITIAQEAKIRPLLDSSGKFTVEGTLRYQACDDHVCYIPQMLKVQWTLQYADFDRQRVPKELQRK